MGLQVFSARRGALYLLDRKLRAEGTIEIRISRCLTGHCNKYYVHEKCVCIRV